jgi:hypothetical protein
MPEKLRFLHIVLTLLCASVGLLAMLGLARSLQDAYNTTYVFLPRISRYRPAADVPWQQAIIFMLGLFAWSLAGFLSLVALARPVVRWYAAATFGVGAGLLLLSYWSAPFFAAVFSLVASPTCFICNVGRPWVPIALVVVAAAMFAYAAT